MAYAVGHISGGSRIKAAVFHRFYQRGGVGLGGVEFHDGVLVESAIWEASLFEENDFHDFKISVKHHDVLTMIQAYRMLSEAGDWPLHLGVTEAGPAFQGTIKYRS